MPENIVHVIKKGFSRNINESPKVIIRSKTAHNYIQPSYIANK